MRAALFALLGAAGAAGAAGCKIDLDARVFEDAREERLCRISETAPICIAAANEMPSDFAWLQKNMFSTNCSGDDCHSAAVNGQPPDGRLVLAEGFSYKVLMGKDATDPGPAPLVASEFQTDHKLVEPGAPERSYLMFMLKALRANEGVPRFTPPPADVGYMPQSNNTLCCQKLDVVARWIAAGANP